MLDRYNIVNEDDLRDAMIKAIQKASCLHNVSQSSNET